MMMKILAFMKLLLFKVQYQAQTFKKNNRRKTKLLFIAVDVDEKINKTIRKYTQKCVAYNYEIVYTYTNTNACN